MVSIIRSAEISDQKRKLASRIAPSRPAVVAESGATQPQRSASPPSAQESSQTAIALEVKRQVEQERLAMQAEAKKQAEAARDQAWQKGLEEGRKAGAEEARKSVDAELARVHTIAEQLRVSLESGIRGMDEIAVALAFEAVCKMVGNTAHTKDGVQALVRQAAAHAVNTEQMVVRLHAGDLDLLRTAEALDPALPSGVAVSWVADNSIKLGGCVVETAGGELDARLETQFERLRAALLAAR